jgi:hypothetical protein
MVQHAIDLEAIFGPESHPTRPEEQKRGGLAGAVPEQSTASPQRLAELRRLYLSNGADPTLWGTIEPALLSKEAHGWSADPELRQRQWSASDAIDAAFLAGDVDGLRAAANHFLALFPSTGGAADER